MKLLIFALAIIISANAKHSSRSAYARQGMNIIKEVVKNNLTDEWRKTLGTQFTKIANVSKFFAKYGGPAGELLILGLMVLDDAPQDDTKEHLQNITNHLDALSKQIAQLDAKLDHSVQKIVTEVKFQNYVNYLIGLKASKKRFESIIASFASNSTLFVHRLDHFIQKFYDDDYDVKLVDVLDFKIGTYNSIIDDFITLSRSYHEGNKDGNSTIPQTSTMQNIFEFYISILMNIINANVIQESAVNLKTTITGNNYEEDRRHNHHRTNEIIKSFFGSIKKAVSKLNEKDLDITVDFSVNGNTAQIRMINVLQTFWIYSDTLGSSERRYSTFGGSKRKHYYGSGCDGFIRNCNYERKKRQPGPPPPPRGPYLRKCTCDKIEHKNTTRKLFTGRIEAPEGYVVTGIKFIEFNRAIYPQIEVGKLLPMAMIGSVYWLNVSTDDNFFTFDFDSREMSFEDSKTMRFLNSVVTGVQFKESSPGVVWTIYGRKLDFNRGILGQEQLKQSNDPIMKFDMYGKIEGLSSSTKFFVRNVTKIKFSTSSEGYDKGKSFVPYFDGNAVTMDTKAPLSGIGLIQYTNDWKYAGYIRPVLSSLDYRTYFNTSYELDKFVPVNYTELIEAKREKIKKLYTNVHLN